VADLTGGTGATGSGGSMDPLVGHAGHDPEVVASLLDGDLVGAGRAAAAQQVSGCSTCSALHRDLLVLASATRALPTPARTLDFRLTAADAARLREPIAAAARLTGDMQSTSAHASHDTILVASLADHSLAAPEREAANALVDACGLCAALHTDLVALSAATRAMPTPTRPRDYTLTPDDAVRLRPGGWRRWIAVFGTSRDAFSRPLAVGLTTLGLAGLLVATLPSVLQGQGATSLSTVGAAVGDRSAPALGVLPEAARSAVAAGPEAAAPSPNGAPPGAPSVPPGQTDTAGAAGNPADQGSPHPAASSVADGIAKGVGAGATGGSTATSDVNVSDGARTPAQGATGISSMILVSGALLMFGIGLFLIRWTARRLATG